MQQERIEGFSADEYAAFLEKFEEPKTTDDCYTPPNVYQAVVDWCVNEYGIVPDRIVRPFFPGGDYQSYLYNPDDIVLDNPPFSILSEIVKFYNERGIRYFLFAPALTVFSAHKNNCAICLGVQITYTNGAKVTTSFLTNLDCTALRSAPSLYNAIRLADAENKATKTVPKYEYPDFVITSSKVSSFSKYGVCFSVAPDQCRKIAAMDRQKEKKKTIFGSGFLLSEKAAAEKAAAEKAAAEKAGCICWELSEREKEIVAELSGKLYVPEEQVDENQVSLF